LHDPETINSDDDIHTVDLTIIPTNVTYPPSEGTSESASELLFEALSACANLHPDPASPGSDEGHATAPGAGGWITAENMNDFLDADGNFVGASALGPAPGTSHIRVDGVEGVQTMNDLLDAEGNFVGVRVLGPGAGTVHIREDEGEEEVEPVNGAHEHEEETKWRRTS
jgi:chloride channel, nucleotide-sensitive, 1A